MAQRVDWQSVQARYQSKCSLCVGVAILQRMSIFRQYEWQTLLCVRENWSAFLSATSRFAQPCVHLNGMGAGQISVVCLLRRWDGTNMQLLWGLGWEPFSCERDLFVVCARVRLLLRARCVDSSQRGVGHEDHRLPIYGRYAIRFLNRSRPS